MKLKLALLPLALAAGFAAYVALHPGMAYSKPRMASGTATHFAEQATYSIDPVHSSIYFEITHLGLAKVHGRFNKFGGKIREDAQDLTKSSVEFTAQIDSVDTAVAARDEHLRKGDYFDAAKYPELSFKSTKIAKAKEGYVATGDLTIKDKTKVVSIPFKHYGPLKGFGNQPSRIGVVAEPITLKRSDFGVGADQKLPDGTVALSDELTVRISIEGTLDK